MKYPFLISVPHGGTEIPREVRPLFALSDDDIRYYCDPFTCEIFGFQDEVAAFIDTPISRMVVDLNRPPLPLPPKDPDGIIKVRTIDGREVYAPGKFPDLVTIHRLMKKYYFPYHQKIDELIDQHPVKIAFDCHSMLPFGSSGQKDADRTRPLICLGNNGDRYGRGRSQSLTTCPPLLITELASAFRDEFSCDGEVAINDPFSGGFIANALFWHKGIPFIQIEINRMLYEIRDSCIPDDTETGETVAALKKRIWQVLTRFWDRVG